MGKLSVKFMLWTVIVVLLGISLLGWIMMRSLESEVRGRADQEAKDQVETMLTVLQTVDNLSSQSVRSAMRVLLQEGARIGVPENGSRPPSRSRLFPACVWEIPRKLAILLWSII